MKRMALPSLFNNSTIRKSSSTSFRERAAVGSSMMTTRASTDRARATATKCLLAIPRRVAEKDIFSHRQIVEEHRLLMDGGNPLGESVVGRRERHRAAIQQQ